MTSHGCYGFDMPNELVHLADPIGVELDAAQAHYLEVTAEATRRRQAAVKAALGADPKWTRYRIAKRWSVHPNTVAAIEASIAAAAKHPTPNPKEPT